MKVFILFCLLFFNKTFQEEYFNKRKQSNFESLINDK